MKKFKFIYNHDKKTDQDIKKKINCFELSRTRAIYKFLQNDKIIKRVKNKNTQ